MVGGKEEIFFLSDTIQFTVVTMIFTYSLDFILDNCYDIYMSVADIDSNLGGGSVTTRGYSSQQSGVSGVLPCKYFDHIKTKNVILSSILNVFSQSFYLNIQLFLRVGNIDLMRDIVKGVELKKCVLC